MAGNATTPAIRFIGTVVLAIALGGCYSMHPAPRVVPDAGVTVAFDVNDAGRVALGPTMVPEIARIEGRVLDAQDSSYLIAVSTVRTLRGGVQVWSGEQVRVNSQHVGTTYTRQFDRTRTLLLGASVVAGFAAILVTRSLVGSGNDDSDEDPPVIEVRTAVPPLLPFWRLTPRGAFP